MSEYIGNCRNSVQEKKHPFIQFSDVSLQINGQKLIKNMNCTLENSGKTVVLGPNGAGKSLFLRLLARLLKPTSGHVKVNFREEKNLGKNELAFVFQNPVLLHRSVFKNLSFVLRPQKIPTKQVKQIVMEALIAAKLEGCAKTPARKLSGGEQQRLALARALIVDPWLVLLDEPTASLDPNSTFLVEEMINKADAKGAKTIFVTHDIGQAKRLADDIIFIHDGTVITQNRAQEFFNNPVHVEVQNYLDGRVRLENSQLAWAKNKL